MIIYLKPPVIRRGFSFEQNHESEQQTKDMVTKITVDFPTKFSMVKDKPPGVYGIKGFDHAAFIEKLSDHLEKIHRLVILFEQFPNANVKESINIFFGECNISVTEKTKKKRVYGIWLCYIHEED